jgi:hypothetical protein
VLSGAPLKPFALSDQFYIMSDVPSNAPEREFKRWGTMIDQQCMHGSRTYKQCVVLQTALARQVMRLERHQLVRDVQTRLCVLLHQKGLIQVRPTHTELQLLL